MTGPSLGTVSVEEIGSAISTPKLFQLYFHKDRGLTGSMIERCIAANFDVLALTVDTITGEIESVICGRASLHHRA